MHLLVIEDNPDLVANLYDFFEDRGHTVDAAYDAFSGLKFAFEQEYDAIILDLMLPGMDGLEVCTRLREAGQQIPVLMLTARDTLDNKLDGFASGADDYLVKPFALTELEARLQSLIRRARGGQALGGRLRVADLSFDPNTLYVERGGRRIELPPIPLKLLELLMRKSPRVVSREELEREVWGDSPPDSDALRAHMHVLRSAIDVKTDRALLRTVRGIGYRLVEPDAY
ncbi:MAG: response regulator transcription factor [Gammaproteobacteria bacterium]|jgi:DNA-binding response OmpR family regulator|nr:response regulator transcription factor [Gammaproteobacteria bacterium]